MDAYVQAMKQVVKPDSVVVDIGAGTGIASLIACRLGAARVYAIEPNQAIVLAKEIAAKNGYGDRIKIYQETSGKVNLPEKADVIVSDMRGSLPLLASHIPTIIDARTRFLKADGVQIPQRDMLMIAGIDSPKTYDLIATPWTENEFALDMGDGLKFVLNSLGRGTKDEAEILLEQQQLATLDYTSISTPDVVASCRWQASRHGTLHGYQVWFDAVLVDGISFSTGPHAPESVYGTSFFPLLEPVKLVQGDTVSLKMSAKLVNDEYIWLWRTCIEREQSVVAEFNQNSFLSVPLSLADMKKRSEHYKPSLNEEGEIVKTTLEMMDRNEVLGKIAARLQKNYPVRFKTWEEALAFAGKVCIKYS